MEVKDKLDKSGKGPLYAVCADISLPQGQTFIIGGGTAQTPALLAVQKCPHRDFIDLLS